MKAPGDTHYILYKDRLCLYIKLSLFFTLSQKEFLPVVKLSRKSTEVIAQYDTWEVKTEKNRT